MLDNDLLLSVATQLLASDVVELNGQRFQVRHTSTRHLRCVSFELDGVRYEAIEQNPDKPSRWGQLARAGHNVVQVKNPLTNRFVAVGVDGKVKVYGAAV